MSAPARSVLGLLVVVLLIVAGLGLLRTGLYGWTIFVLFPVTLGGLVAWISRPATGWGAASRGALSAAAASCLLVGLGTEGFICIVMALPLVVPLGALGGLLVH